MFEAYNHAIAALALWAVLVSVLAGYSTTGRTAEKRCDCGKPKRDYSDPAYRRERAFMNAVENSGPFIAVTVAAILVGAAPFWVNLFASLFIAARVAMAIVHIATVNQPARSLFFAFGLLMIAAQAVLVLLAAF
ncbi:putative MAPEG superfamily protein [Sulfitobacter undariae]|uniref:Putative MAPEG superfamily protein n=1 Tax=Sulfitobacter undariae TaxID=1563671 RepID=A0A7W6E2S2_9RHOB|nr:MAPEG family protein [Sulfitobacter undariae]MBB3993726.1 putative MAPEG superfamily protein [Sulfitobacter undariae]